MSREFRRYEIQANGEVKLPYDVSIRDALEAFDERIAELEQERDRRVPGDVKREAVAVEIDVLQAAKHRLNGLPRAEKPLTSFSGP